MVAPAAGVRRTGSRRAEPGTAHSAAPGMYGAGSAGAATDAASGPHRRSRAAVGFFAGGMHIATRPRLAGTCHGAGSCWQRGGRMKASRTLLALLAAVPAMASPAAVASRVEPLSLFGISAGKGGSSVSVPMQIIILLTLMTLLPAAVMCITPFLRIT